MADLKFSATHTSGQWDTAMLKANTSVSDAVAGAVRDAGNLARAGAAANIAAAGFDDRWQRSMKVKFYRNKDQSRGPAALIYSTIWYSRIFEDGGKVSSPWGLLWVALSNAPFNKKLTPKQYVAQVGPLFTIKRPNGRPLLAAKIRVTAAQVSRGISLRVLKHGATAKTGTYKMIPLYVGIPQAIIAKRFDIAGVVQRARDDIAVLYLRNLKV